MNILALDLGTKTGWAASKDSFRVGGTWRLADESFDDAKNENALRRLDPRFVVLANHVYSACVGGEIDLIIFEDVLFSKYTYQTQLWSSLRAALWSVNLRKLDQFPMFDCVDTSRLKKFATGHGGATKKMMAAHLHKKHPDRFFKLDNPKEKQNIFLGAKGQPLETQLVDDNQVDAEHLLDYALLLNS